MTVQLTMHRLPTLPKVNIAHYRNSADFEESCFLTGQPTLFITHSLSMEQWTEYNPGGIKLGSRAGHVLGDTGSATLLQADANSLVGDAMIKKESQMVAIRCAYHYRPHWQRNGRGRTYTVCK